MYQIRKIGMILLSMFTGAFFGILIFGVIGVGIGYLIASEYTVLGLVLYILLMPAGAIVLSVMDMIEERDIELEERAEERRKRAAQREKEEKVLRALEDRF